METTTALFVPPNSGGQLTAKLEKVEDTLREELGWAVKIVEQSGIPLAQMFKPEFEMVQGCALADQCQFCQNTGIKCGTKNVIYSAECIECGDQTMKKQASSDSQELCPQPISVVDEVEEQSESTQNPLGKPMYIGETVRPIRKRIQEHLNNARLFKPESFIIQHWADRHRISPTPPSFKFKILRTCKDSLSRQVGEAVWIMEAGTLNNKSEFGLNHICRMVPSKHPALDEHEWKSELNDRKYKKKIY